LPVDGNKAAIARQSIAIKSPRTVDKRMPARLQNIIFKAVTMIITAA
jgi:hypothetical protein